MTQSLRFCPGRNAKTLILTTGTNSPALTFNTIYYVARANVHVVNENRVAEIIFESSIETGADVIGVALLQGGRGDRITVSDSIFCNSTATGEGVGVLIAMPLSTLVQYSDRRSSRWFRLEIGAPRDDRYPGMIDITDERRHLNSVPL